MSLMCRWLPRLVGLLVLGCGSWLLADDKAANQPSPASATHDKSSSIAEKPTGHLTPTATAGAQAASQEHGPHHDVTDLSHQNATHALHQPLDWRSDSAIATLLIFLCLLALLSKFAWRPVMDGLEARERAIAASIDDAKRSAEKAAEQLRHYEAKLAAATEETRAILDQARRNAELATERILAEAQESAQRERQRAIEDITAAKTVALQEITQKSVDLAVELAGRLIHQKLRPDDHLQLIREMVDQFPSRN